jgi:hypothetical protein
MTDLSQEQFEKPVSRKAELVAGAALILVSAAGTFVGLSWAVFDNPRRLWELVTYGLLIAGIGIIGIVLGLRLVLHRTRQRDGGLMSPNALRLGGVALLVGSALPLARGGIGVLHIVGMLGAVLACFVLARKRESMIGDRQEPEAGPNKPLDPAASQPDPAHRGSAPGR